MFPPTLKRVVVAIDPSGTSGDENKRSDNIGIIVAAKGMDDTGYVLAGRERGGTGGAGAKRP
jgi:phage terminase large subunit-like protein